MPWFLRLLSATLLVIGAVIASAAPAHAHAELIRSSPEVDGLVTTDLDLVRLTFTPLARDSEFTLEVVDVAGNDVTSGPAVRTDQGTIEVPVDLETEGDHTVTYEVIGIDNDPDRRSFTFTVEQGSSSSSLPIIVLWVLALAVVAVFFLRRPKKAPKKK